MAGKSDNLSVSKGIAKGKLPNRLALWERELQKSPEKFYGKSIPTTRWAKKLFSLHSQPIISPLKKFPTQALAFEYANQQNDSNSLEQYFVFAMELREAGKRAYVVSTLHGFWSSYETIEKRWYYEVIPEKQPCHLYFDLEYSFAFPQNATKSKEKLVCYFEHFLCHTIQEILCIPCSSQSILRLDATSAKKFSQHWIVKLPGYMFANNIECGAFVRLLLIELERNAQSTLPIVCDGKMDIVSYSEIAEYCSAIMDENGSVGYFIDTGVYTRNRNFRLYGSQKRTGMSPPLYVAKSCTYPLPQAHSRIPLNFDVFLHSLITYSGRLYKSTTKTEIQLIRCAHKLPQINIPSAKSAPIIRYSTSPAISSKMPFDESQVQKLDAFVLRWLQNRTKNSTDISIRKRLFIESTKQISYSISGTRFCENINREHKSNHIFVVTDLQTAHIYQKCLDPDCKSFIGALYPIPQTIIFPLKLILDSEALFTDEILAQEIEKNVQEWP